MEALVVTEVVKMKFYILVTVVLMLICLVGYGGTWKKYISALFLSPKENDEPQIGRKSIGVP